MLLKVQTQKYSVVLFVILKSLVLNSVKVLLTLTEYGEVASKKIISLFSLT